MKEVFGNAWDLRKNYTYLGIATNGFVKSDGACVMGRGIALQLKQRDPKAPYRLGSRIKANGNIVQKFYGNVIAFPTKHNWWEKSDINLIKKSCKQLMELLGPNETILLPRVGCGNGGLDWNDVGPIVSKLLDDRVTIVHYKEGEK